MGTVAITTCGIGKKFYVEPPEGDPIPVQVIAHASWSLVHGVMDVPCRRLDTNEDVMVSIRADAEVTPVEEEVPDGS